MPLSTTATRTPRPLPSPYAHDLVSVCGKPHRRRGARARPSRWNGSDQAGRIEPVLAVTNGASASRARCSRAGCARSPAATWAAAPGAGRTATPASAISASSLGELLGESTQRGDQRGLVRIHGVGERRGRAAGRAGRQRRPSRAAAPPRAPTPRQWRAGRRSRRFDRAPRPPRGPGRRRRRSARPASSSGT